MLTAVEVPRTPGGKGIALCHHCQRNVYFAGGFLRLLVKTLDRTARFGGAKPTNLGIAEMLKALGVNTEIPT